MSAEKIPILEVPVLAPTQRLVELAPVSFKNAITGAQPQLRTALRLGWRDGALLARFDARDRGTVATLTARDAPLWKEDVVEVFLSPFDPARVYYEFEVNPLGALFDARVECPDLSRGTMRVETAWRCPGFSARVRCSERRWTALLRIPLAPMAAAGPPALWRGNFYRIDRGDPDEFSAWTPTFADPPDFHLPERFGLLRLPAQIGSSVHRFIG